MPWVIPVPVRGDDGDNYIGDNSLAYERMHGYGGDDTLAGSTLYDTVFGGDGNDSVTGHRAEGGAGDDTVLGVQVYGGDGDDNVSTGLTMFDAYGGAGNDNILATSGSDIVYGGGGNDELWGQMGRGLFFGGAGRDGLFGGIGNDTVFGGGGRDLIQGGGRADWLVGGADDDTVIGDNGSETIIGGAGLDDMTGYDGSDQFRFRSAEEIGNDWGAGASFLERITDFTSGEDVIDLRPMQVDFAWVNTAAFSGHGPELRFDSSRSLLQGDVDGDGAADFTLDLPGVSSLAGSDLLT